MVVRDENPIVLEESENIQSQDREEGRSYKVIIQFDVPGSGAHDRKQQEYLGSCMNCCSAEYPPPPDELVSR